MVIRHDSFGKGTGVLVRFRSNDGATTVNLGYTRDGVDTTIEEFWHTIHSDDYGGEGGSPSDEQIIGCQADVYCEFHKYDKTEIDKLSSYVYSGGGAAFGGVAGTLPAFGTFMRQDAVYGALDLVGAVYTRSFPVAFPRAPKEVKQATKNSIYRVGFRCWPITNSNRVLWTETANT